MPIFASLSFVIVTVLAFSLFGKKILSIRKNILLGKDINLSDQPAERWKNVFLLALGQKKMFRNPLVAFLHLIVYVGFIIINIELLSFLIFTIKLDTDESIDGINIFELYK